MTENVKIDTFADRIKKRKKESLRIADLMDEQLILFEKIQKVIPDVNGTWNHGCVGSHEVIDSPIFSARSVAKNWDEISFGALGCCHEHYDNPYFARAIQIVEGQRIRATHKVCVARYDNWGDGYRPEKGWKKDIEKYFGAKAIPIVQEFLDKHPYEEPDEDDDNDDYDEY